jgi:hypothetical protein
MTELLNTDSKLVRPGELYKILPNGQWEFFVDSSALREFLDCEAKFELRYIQRIMTRGREFKMDIGSWWSGTLELYYNALRAGSLSKTDVVDFASHVWDNRKMEELKIDSPKSYEDFGGKAGGVAMALEYYEWASPLDAARWRIISVEEGSGRLRELLVGETPHVKAYYIVKPDLFVVEDGVLTPIDHKTKDFINLRLIHDYKPHLQTLGYVFAGQELARSLNLDVQCDRTTINVAARKVPKTKDSIKPRFMRFPVQYSVDQITAWRTRVVRACERLRYCIENNIFAWNDNSCHKYAGCSYRPIHSQPEGSWPIVISSSFVKGPIWTPYLTDGEREED